MTQGIDRRGLFIAAGCAVAVPAIARAQTSGGLPGESASGGWINEPAKWSRNAGVLTIHAEPKTDFWRKTYFGYVTDNGHFLGRPVRGDFRATVNVAGAFAAQYDQAGLMVRLDETCWMKCGVEYVDGRENVSSVFTRDYSDWAGIPRDEPADSLWFRLDRKGSALTFSFSLDGAIYREVRQGYLTDAAEVQLGLMAAAPEGPGFAAEFRDFEVGPLTDPQA